MPVPSVPSLLLGLTARLLIDMYISPRDSSMRDYGLFGLWQGVAIYYAFTFSQELAAIATFFITVKLVFEFNSEQDPVKFVTTFIGAALGVFGTDLLSRYLGDGLYQKRKPKSSSQSTPERHKSRSVNFTKSGVGENGGRDALRKTSRISPSDITSVDNSSDLLRSSSSSMSALDREVARLRTRASLADTERRRFKEERKWALSQGNLLLATQLAWEVKRYKTLMQSFHEEADALVIRASNARRNGTDGQQAPTPDRNVKPNGTALPNPSTTTQGVAISHRRQKSGTPSKTVARAR